MGGCLCFIFSSLSPYVCRSFWQAFPLSPALRAHSIRQKSVNILIYLLGQTKIRYKCLVLSIPACRAMQSKHQAKHTGLYGNIGKILACMQKYSKQLTTPVEVTQHARMYMANCIPHEPWQVYKYFFYKQSCCNVPDTGISFFFTTPPGISTKAPYETYLLVCRSRATKS